MRTDLDDLPAIDPSRSHLDILRGALEVLEAHQPTVDDCHGNGYHDCAVCDFPLDGNVSPKMGKHGTYQGRFNTGPCAHLRAVAELQAWVRVEETLAQEAEERKSEITTDYCCEDCQSFDPNWHTEECKSIINKGCDYRYTYNMENPTCGRPTLPAHRRCIAHIDLA